MRKLKIAVVGCGAVAQIHHLPALAASENAEAALLVDADEARARSLAERFGVPGVSTDFRDAAGRADAAIVALPNNLHAPVSIELLRRGVPVLVEKPMATSLAECDAMIETAERSGVALAVGLEFRFFESTRLVGSLLNDGLLGPLRGFELRQGVIPLWPFATDFLLRRETAGGGVLADFGVHVFDLLLLWLGEWESVDYRDDARGGLESDAELRLRMKSGLEGTVEISRTRNLRNTCVFEGERATLEVGIWDPDPVISLRFGDREMALEGHARKPGDGSLSFQESFVRQIDDFAAAVREGREPRVSGREGRRSIALVEACYAVRKPWVMPWEDPPELAGWKVSA
jgi:predicted dehydrogenase